MTVSWNRTLLQLLAACLGYLCVYAWLVRAERRALAGLTLSGDRRWGPLWPLVDVLRALGTRTSAQFGRTLLGPLLGLALALAALLLLPVGPALMVGGFRLWAPFSTWDPDLLSLAALGLASALGTWLTGALSPSAGVREGAHATVSRALAHAAPGLLALSGAALVTGEFSVAGLVRWQNASWPLALYQPLGLLLSALCAVLSGRRLPARDDVPEPCLLDFHLQHAGRGWAIAHLSEYLTLLYASAVIALVYLGGCDVPTGFGLPGLAAKTLLVLLALLWLRQRWYRVWRQRYEAHALPLLLALGALNLLVTAAALIWRSTL
ncbi:MAG: NADH-quinone oxidoreductase subunit H [Chloroflexi bacterium]|nr:NADH-quinone oxidoreductase subunit H [Chloroflexota bacterium]